MISIRFPYNLYDISIKTGDEMVRTHQNERKLKSRKVKGEVLDLQNGAAFLSGVKIRGGTGLLFLLRVRTGSVCPWKPGENWPI